MVESTTLQIAEPLLDYVLNGRIWKPVSKQSDWRSPYNVYRCKGDDKWVAISVSTEEEWSALCTAMGGPEWTDEARFSDQQGRQANRDELDKLVTDWTLEYSHGSLVETLQGVAVPSGIPLDSEELGSDPQLVDRGCFPTIEHPVLGKRRVLSIPWRAEGMEPDYGPAPLIGEHNNYVFGDLLGLSDREIDRLIFEEVIC